MTTFSYDITPALEIPVDMVKESIAYDLPYINPEIHRKAKEQGKSIRIISVTADIIVVLREFTGPQPADFLHILYQDSSGEMKLIGAHNFSTALTYDVHPDLTKLFGTNNFGVNVFKFSIYGNSNNGSPRKYLVAMSFRGEYEVTE